MASRNCASVGMLLLMFFCFSSARRLSFEHSVVIAPSVTPSMQIQSTQDWEHDPASELFVKPSSEYVPSYKDDRPVGESLENSAGEPWDLDHPAGKEKQDGNDPGDSDTPPAEEEQDDDDEIEILHRPMGKEKQDGDEPGDVDTPAEEEDEEEDGDELEMLDHSDEKEKQDGNIPWDFDHPAEREEQDGNELGDFDRTAGKEKQDDNEPDFN